MAGYADLASVKADLSLSDAVSGDAGAIAKIVALNDRLSLAFDGKVGVTWGTYAVETRVIEAPGISDLLILDVPVSGVTAVETGGTWTGTTWTGGTTVAATYLRTVYGGLGLHHIGGAYWSGPVRITGRWGDKLDLASVPADVVDALTVLVTGTYRQETVNARQASDSFDETGETYAPNPWNSPRVKAAIERYARTTAVV